MPDPTRISGFDENFRGHFFNQGGGFTAFLPFTFDFRSLDATLH